MRTGIATVPLDYGKCPPWLFERMKKLARSISIAIVEEFGSDELIKRFSDPVWFQSFGCVLGFDWNSSGLTTTTLGALKEGIRGLESDLGIFVCGGKGRTSKKTPQQIQEWGQFLAMSLEKIDSFIYASKISAKIDSSLIQDGFQLYHHDFIFNKSGKWTVVQQGMNIDFKKARRYHWYSDILRKIDNNKIDYIEEPHSGIVSDFKSRPLNLTAKESRSNRDFSVGIVKEEPKKFLKDFRRILEKSVFLKKDSLISQRRFNNFSKIELNDIEFHWHPVVNEKFDLKRLEKTIFSVNEQKPQSFEEILSLKGVGPKTIRALSLVSEIIYGAKPSYEDPARYSFAHGGKDGTPFPVNRNIYDKVLAVMEKGIKKSNISLNEKIQAKKRLNSFRK